MMMRGIQIGLHLSFGLVEAANSHFEVLTLGHKYSHIYLHCTANFLLPHWDTCSFHDETKTKHPSKRMVITGYEDICMIEPVSGLCSTC
ncbi:hypothetical protein Leryth_004598 [Lithospermum erythrorhizon]|nr:hypothetical protein Leryth_004598 [Lithospermum erythrorhizon]